MEIPNYDGKDNKNKNSNNFIITCPVILLEC